MEGPQVATIHSLVDIAQWRALHQPQRQSYTFLTDAGDEGSSIDYEELDRRARIIAADLQTRHLENERAVLLYSPGIEYIVAFFGCLYAGTVAVPVYPPHLNRSVGRVLSILEDAQPKVILTDSRTLAESRRRLAKTSSFNEAQWIATDILDEELANTWQKPPVIEESLALLQYSSGSTSSPKGVMLTHKNLLHNVGHGITNSQISSESIGVSWLPPYHDMGLIGGIILPLYGGFQVISMSPFSFLQRPIRWLQTISKYRGTHSAAPDFAYTHCVKKTTPEERASLDLSSWKVAFSGAEPIHAETLDLFTEAFEPSGFKRETFYPCYGLAEATLLVTSSRCQSEPVVQSFDGKELLQNNAVPVSSFTHDARLLVGCGKSLSDQKVLIVHPHTLKQCASDEVGEIWVAGPGVAQGYLNKLDESIATFQAFLADTGEGPFLRTGDAGILLEGELYIAGRLKDLIIIRGNNYYPQDIEYTVGASHYALRQNCTAAFSVEKDNEEQLIVVQEVDRHAKDLDMEEACAIIQEAVIEQHDILIDTIVLIKHGSIPKTSSGKIQRYLCRDAFLKGSLSILKEHTLSRATQVYDERYLLSSTFVAPRTELEKVLADAWSEVLGMEQVGVEDDFFELGGHSLLAMQLITRSREIFNREVPLRLLFENSTIAGIIRSVEALEAEEKNENVPELVSLKREASYHLEP